jgi:hypothetical protein
VSVGTIVVRPVSKPDPRIQSKRVVSFNRPPGTLMRLDTRYGRSKSLPGVSRHTVAGWAYSACQSSIASIAAETRASIDVSPFPCETLRVFASGLIASMTGMPTMSSREMSASRVMPYRASFGSMTPHVSSARRTRWVPSVSTFGWPVPNNDAIVIHLHGHWRAP